jgi:chemotaxis response regulator CheB
MAERPIVLLVDDDPMMRDLLASVFGVDGNFRIGGVAADGFEGAMLAAEVTPDVVILDYFMPRWDGEKAAGFIRRSCPKSKIVAFSAVLGQPPTWADHFVMKTDIGKLIPLCRSLCEPPTNN